MHIVIALLLLVSGIGQDAAAIMDRAEKDGFSGVVLAVRGGRPVFERAFGAANHATGAPFTVDTAFSIASVTKQFTRAAILVLEQQGRLSLSDSIVKHLPELPADKAPITLQHLFDMKAGLHEYHDSDGAVPGDHQPMTRAEAIAKIGAQKLHFAPGTDRLYSNSGYTLLAAVIERLSNTAFETFVRDALLTPAGMQATGFYGDRRWNGMVARGAGPTTYLDNDPEAWPAPQWTLIGSGGMVSTAGDLAKWIRAVRSGHILSQASVRKMYPRAEWAFYAGGNSFGYETSVIEFNDGADFVILHSNKGMGRAALAGEVAAAMRGEPLPEGLRQAIDGGRALTRTTGPQAQGGEVRLPGTPDTPAKRAAAALLAALRDGTDAALTAFVKEQMTPEARNEYPMPEHLNALRALSTTMRSSGRVQMAPTGENEVTITFAGGETVRAIVTTTGAPPHLVTGIEVKR